MKITILMDNEREREELFCEHGFSALVELDGHRILYDTGSSGRFLDNARLLGLDLSDVTEVVLSHGHWDHVCGLPRFVEEQVAPKAPLYLHSRFFLPKYIDEGDYLRYLGASFGPEWLSRMGVRARYLTAPTHRLWENGPVWLLSGFEQTVPFERVAPVFRLMDGARLMPDKLEDELALVVETDGGLVVLSGCSHNGMLNICEAARRRLGKPVRAFLGGTHLIDADEAQAAGTLEALRAGRVGEAYVCHCTGAEGVRTLTAAGNCRQVRAGAALDF